MSASSPAEVHARFTEAFNAADMEALLNLYEPDATLLLNGEPMTGHDRIREALSAFLEMKGEMTMVTKLVFESESEGIALLNGAWLLEAGGVGKGVAMRGLSSEVVRRQPDGTWRFVLDNPFTPEH